MNARKTLRDFLQIALATVFAALLLRVFVVGAIRIPSPSMEPTLLIGDALFVNKLAYIAGEPRRGDILMFEFPFNAESSRTDHYVKRCVACPGDTVVVTDGRVYVNGAEALAPGQSAAPGKGEFMRSDGKARIVPADRYFVLGDNRENSSDSRFWGFVPRKNIVGRATIIYWSRGSEGIRWERSGRMVR